MTRARLLAIAAELLVLAPSAAAAGKSRRVRMEVVQTSSDLSNRLTRLPDVTFGPSPPAGFP